MKREAKKPVTSTPTRTESRLQRLALTADDFRALDHICKECSQQNRSAALRFAVEQQRHRDRYFDHKDEDHRAKILGSLPTPAKYKSLAAGVRETVGLAQHRLTVLGLKKPTNAVQLKQWAVWLYPVQDKALDEIGDRWGLESKIDSIRLAFRVQAELSGFVPKGGKWS